MIHYYIHGRGRGHATRSQVVIRTLRAAGYQVRIFAGEAAQVVFAGDHTPVLSLPVGLGAEVPGLLMRRIRAVQAELAADQARLVISDGDMPAMLGRRRAGVPGIAIGHGLVFAHCRRPAGAPRLPWWREALKARLASLAASHCIAVNFAELPALSPRQTTLARPSMTLEDGAEVDVSPEARRLAGERPVICYFRDENGEALVRTVAAQGLQVGLFGSKLREPLAGVTTLPFSTADFRYLLQHGRAVLSSAGSQLMSECLFYGIPQLALYRATDDEQRLNAHMLKSVATYSRGIEHAACTPEAVAAFLQGLPGQRSPIPEGVPQSPVDEVVLNKVKIIMCG